MHDMEELHPSLNRCRVSSNTSTEVATDRRTWPAGFGPRRLGLPLGVSCHARYSAQRNERSPCTSGNWRSLSGFGTSQCSRRRQNMLAATSMRIDPIWTEQILWRIFYDNLDVLFLVYMVKKKETSKLTVSSYLVKQMLLYGVIPSSFIVSFTWHDIFVTYHPSSIRRAKI